MKVLTVIGARPQFVKAAAVSPLLRHAHVEILLHTGQHYDREMSDVFFHELGIPEPDIHLNVGSGSHGTQTAAMLSGIESAILGEKPDAVLIYGDTNSTLAAALAAAKLHIPIAHVEAGLRSFNRRMPEEINRVVADSLSELLFCPTETAVRHLQKEGITKGVHLTGDVMADILGFATKQAEKLSGVLTTYSLKPREYALATVHRAENTDDPVRLRSIMEALNQLNLPVMLPLHPRTRARLGEINLSTGNNLQILPPLGYLDMVQLTRHSSLVLTDSGGLQKEACWLGVPCVTLRDETEWVETVESGGNKLAGADVSRILSAARSFASRDTNGMAPSLPPPAGGRIVELLTTAFA